jgi:GDP-L-fucose synthase
MKLNIQFWQGKRVVVTGGAGFVGSQVVNLLLNEIGLPADFVAVPRSSDCDLRNIENARRAIGGADIVIHLAAVTGGIAFSRAFPASQYRDSTLIDLNVLEASREAGVKKVVQIGNLFAYATEVPSPLDESSLFHGLPGESHRGIGCLKRNLAVMADLYYRQHGLPVVTVFSANAYGPGDSMDLRHSHVIPSLIMKCLSQPALEVWGDGTPTRDFLFVEEVARGLLLAAEGLAPPCYINLGSGHEVSVRQIVEWIVEFTGFKGLVSFDASKGGGDARRCVSTESASQKLGFKSEVSMQEGLRRTVEWYRANWSPETATP